MSGHSKWSTIKRKKGVADAAKGKLFTRAAREIIMAAKTGGGDPATNARLRMAIAKAKEVNMPNDNIKRAIQRGTGEIEGAAIEEITYEAYAYAGVALIIECMTDNKNRTLPEIKSLITKAGCNMAEKGAVSYQFAKTGLILFNNPKITEDMVLEIALDYDVDDVKTLDDGSIEVYSSHEQFENLKTAFDSKSLVYENAEITQISSIQIPVSDKETAHKIIALIDKLEENDDVQNIYHNADIPDTFFEE